jgi:hypothetical protein
MNIENIYNRIVTIIETTMGTINVTNNLELDKICNILFRKKYLGTFASDKLPLLSKKKPFAIINIDKYGKGGSHWVACAFQNNNIYIYDSFGRKTKKIIPHLRYKNVIDSDYDAEQNVNEDNCGQRCVAWLLVFQTYGKKNALKI